MRILGSLRGPGSARKWFAFVTVLFGMLAAGLFIAQAGALPSCTDNWVGGSTGDWSVAGNWDHGMPSSTSVACWQSDQTVSVTTNYQSAGSIQGGGLVINGGGLTLSSTSDDSSLTYLQLTGSYSSLTGQSGRTLTLAGDFDWDSSWNEGMSNMTIVQTAGHTATFEGSGYEGMNGSAMTTDSPVTVSDTQFGGSSTLSTSSTITFAPNSYGGNGGTLSMKAAGFITTGTTTAPGYGLTVTGNASSITGGTLTVGKLASTAASTLTIGVGGEIDVGQTLGPPSDSGTILGTVNGPGTYSQVAGLGTINSTSFDPGTLQLNGGNLNIAANASAGGLSILGSYSTLNGQNNATLTVHGDIDWNSTWNEGMSNMTIVQTAGHTATFEGGGYEGINGSSITTDSPVTVSNTQFGGSSTLITTSTITFAPNSYGGNSGTLAMTAAGFVSTGPTTAPGYGLNVTGNASHITGGTLTVGRLASTPSGTLTIADSGEIDVGSGAAPSFDTGTILGTVDGAGTYSQTSGVGTVSSTTFDPGKLELNGGNLNIAANASAGALSIIGSYSTLNGQNDATLTVHGDLDWNSSWNEGMSNMTIVQTAGHTATFEGNQYEGFQGSSITTSSPVTISDPSFAGNASYLTTSSTITFAPNGFSGGSITFTAAGYETSGDTSLPGDTLVQTGGTTTVPSGRKLSSGLFSIQGGTLTDDGTVPAVTLTGGTLAGSGTINGTLTNTGGTVAPGDSPGTLTVTGSYVQGAGATLAIWAGGTAAANYSSLSVAHDVSVDGTLAMAPTGDYAADSAAPGDALSVISYGGSLSGQFASVTSNPPLHDGEPFSADYSHPQIVDAVVGAAVAPVNTGAPVISGDTTAGQTLSTTDGTWSNGPTSFAYQWRDCDTSGNGCADIIGANASTFTLRSADGGHTVRVVVTATNAGGSTSATSASTGVIVVTNLPSVTAVSPAGGPTGGGTVVTITGTNFAPTFAVSFGAAVATTATRISSTEIQALAPAHVPGTVHVTVRTTSGTSAISAADTYTYADVPTIAGLSPNAGPAGGGNTVTISGSGFTAAATVTFGGSAASQVTFDSQDKLDVVVPAHAAGSVDVVVTVPFGGHSQVGTDQDKYGYGPPAVTRVDPAAGPAEGGTSVAIFGTGLVPGATVTFGDTPATSVSYGAGILRATAPARSVGVVDITVTTPAGASPKVGADQYRYYAVPTITAVAPNAGPTSGGNTVTITGTNFTAATTVSFGTTPATSVTFTSSTQLTALVPAHAAGTVDVLLADPSGASSSATDQDKYAYGPPVLLGLSPSSGGAAGGSTVTIAGTGLVPGATVTFGTTAASGVTYSGGSLSATVPAHALGIVAVTVTTPAGTSASASYTYAPATVTAVTPNAGPLKGGNTVTITGTMFTSSSTVAFGTAPAASVTVISSTTITAIAPGSPVNPQWQAPGVVHVSVDGSATSDIDLYAYGAPNISSFAPKQGPITGGNVVTITGTSLVPGTSVWFGSSRSLSVSYVGGALKALAPYHDVGLVNITVETAAGWAAWDDGYAYWTGSGFQPDPDGFGFANYGAAPDSEMQPQDLLNLFGRGVCTTPAPTRKGQKTSSACVLTSAAQAYLDSHNAMWKQGHCFGFSILSTLLWQNELGAAFLDRSTFGTGATHGLKLPGNVPLQRSLSMGANMQTLPSYSSKYGAAPASMTALLADLETALRPGNPTGTTLAIWAPDLSEGHSIVPYAIEPAGPTTFIIRVYDNNYPGDTGRTVQIDTNSGSWRYDTGWDLWYGGTYNIRLYPADPVLGSKTSDCSFCVQPPTGLHPSVRGSFEQRAAAAGSLTEISLTGDPTNHPSLVTIDAQGRRQGVIGGRIVSEIPGGQVLPLIGGLPGRSEPPLQYIPAGSGVNLHIDGSALKANSTGTAATVIGRGSVVAVKGLPVPRRVTDTLSVSGNDASFSFTLARHQPAIKPQFELARQTSSTDVRVTISSPAMPAGAQVSASLDPATLALQLKTRGMPAASSYQVTVTSNDVSGGHVSETVSLHAGRHGASLSLAPLLPPVIGQVKIRPARVSRHGATITYADTQPGSKATIVIEKLVTGHRQGAACTGRPAIAERCSYYKPIGTIKHLDRTRSITIHFTGYLNGRRLVRGTYRLEIFATGASGRKGPPSHWINFVVTT